MTREEAILLIDAEANARMGAMFTRDARRNLEALQGELVADVLLSLIGAHRTLEHCARQLAALTGTSEAPAEAGIATPVVKDVQTSGPEEDELCHVCRCAPCECEATMMPTGTEGLATHG